MIFTETVDLESLTDHEIISKCMLRCWSYGKRGVTVVIFFPCLRDFSGSSVVKNPPANAADMSSVAGLERSPGEGNGNPLQYSCLGNSMDRGTWQDIVHNVPKESDTI